MRLKKQNKEYRGKFVCVSEIVSVSKELYQLNLIATFDHHFIHQMYFQRSLDQKSNNNNNKNSSI